MRIESAYFGWSDLTHLPGCRRPAWQIATKHTPEREGGHGCPAEDCGHDGKRPRVEVRAVCGSCGVAHVIAGEALSSRTTHAATLGYGTAPRKAGGLWLYAGPPRVAVEEAQPDAYLVTREKVARVRPEDVVGLITKTTGKLGGIAYTASVNPVLDVSGDLAPLVFESWGASRPGSRPWVPPRGTSRSTTTTPEGPSGLSADGLLLGEVLHRAGPPRSPGVRPPGAGGGA
ncbi:hypothetical protein ACFWNL_35945, partial [Kitasatospora sp. NPDC058397]|uniref:hypothetical protein n=1 Tax=Kitasatospora sp. NPDC058397 TaxID=3346478 RepID=UPI0036501D0A